MPALLEITDLNIAAKNIALVHSCSLTVEPGEIVGIVGESGSGKTMVAKSILGLLPPGVRRTNGRIVLNGRDIGQYSDHQFRHIRGAVVGMIFQEPMTSLNPSMTIGRQLEEGLRLHRRYTRVERRTQILEMLRRVGILDPEKALSAHPHQFSGGMRQRIMIASVMLLEPALLLADEPTTALDALIQKDVLDLMVELAREKNTAILIVSHDLAMISRYCKRMIVMANGEIVEAGKTADVMQRPTHAYTSRLLASIPKLRPPRKKSELRPIIELQNVAVDYRARASFFGKATSKRAIEHVSLQVLPGEVVALIGESGSGKTTIGRTAAGLLRPTVGSLIFNGAKVNARDANYSIYRQNCQMIFQDPYSSLDPRMTIARIVAEPLGVSGYGNSVEKYKRTMMILEEVGLGSEFAERFPHQLSGGQRQRVAIARALIGNPQFVVADEPVSALDVSMRGQVLELFNRLQARYGFSCLFISHDLDVVEAVADRIFIMRHGEIIEAGDADRVLKSPVHDYARQLLGTRLLNK